MHAPCRIDSVERVDDVGQIGLVNAEIQLQPVTAQTLFDTKSDGNRIELFQSLERLHIVVIGGRKVTIAVVVGVAQRCDRDEV